MNLSTFYFIISIKEKGSTRGEKKARKAILKLGLKQVPDVVRVTMKKYIIFGEAKIEDLAAKQAALNQEQMRQQQQQQRSESKFTSNKTPTTSYDTTATATQGGAEEQVDESGIDPKDIGLVMEQAHCSKAKAVAALRNNNNDLVNAIMELTI